MKEETRKSTKEEQLNALMIDTAGTEPLTQGEWMSAVNVIMRIMKQED